MSATGYKVIALLSPIIALACWEMAVRLLRIPRFVLPPPSTVAVTLIDAIVNEELLVHFAVTTLEIIGGFAFGAGAGILAGIVVAESRIAEAALHPLIVSLNSVPKIAVAPLIVLALGYGYESKVVVASLSAFFPLFVNTTAGLWQADEERMRLARSLRATKFQTFRHVRLPSALPSIFTGLEIGIVLAVVGAVVAEYVGARQGLGYFIVFSDSRIDTAGTIAALVLLAFLGVSLNRAVHVLGRRLVFWENVDSGVQL